VGDCDDGDHAAGQTREAREKNGGEALATLDDFGPQREG